MSWCRYGSPGVSLLTFLLHLLLAINTFLLVVNTKFIEKFIRIKSQL